MSNRYNPKDKSDLLNVIRSEWEYLKSLFDGLPESQMIPTGVEESWSIKDILAHIAAWERVAIDIIQPASMREMPKPYVEKIFENFDIFNANIFQTNQNISLAEVVNRFEDSHLDLMEFIKPLTEEFTFSNLPIEGTEKITVQ